MGFAKSDVDVQANLDKLAVNNAYKPKVDCGYALHMVLQDCAGNMLGVIKAYKSGDCGENEEGSLNISVVRFQPVECGGGQPRYF